MLVKKYALLWLLIGTVLVGAQAQSSADTASAFGTLPANGAATGFSQSTANDLIELDLSSDIIELSADEDDGGGESVSGLLGASRDVFASQVSYNLSVFRFQERGYASGYSSVYFNGFSLQDPETGYANYNVWAGLNDVLRNYTTSYGLEPSTSSYGNLAGVTSYSTTASAYRKQSSVSVVTSNRTYQYRLMATTATGLMDNGWAVTLSASTRLGEGGYMDGTPYEAYSYFLAAEKRFAKRHSLNFTFMGAPVQRGMSSAVIQEAYDLTDSYHYNPRWGYQNGEKRTARIRNTHLPLAMLNYAWNIDEKSKLEAGVSFLFGRNGTSDLDWFDGNDPRPDYYRKFPSYQTEQSMKDYYTAQWQANDPATTQINWDALVAGNQAVNVNRQKGDYQAATIVKEYRNDQQTLRGFANYVNHFSKNFSLYGGLEGQKYKGIFFQTVLDPLGADYILNVDKFAMADRVLDPQGAYYDVNESEASRKKYKGDKYSYDYNIYQNDLLAWAQAKFSHGRFDYYVAGNVGYTEFWRDGKMKNGRFPLNSYGESKKETFLRYAAKANGTYKISGRNYLSLNAGYEERPPLFRHTFLNARYHAITVENYGLSIDNEKILSADANYYYRGSSLRVRASAYYTQSRDASQITIFYSEGNSSLVEYIAQGVDKRYTGIELGASYKLTSTLTLEGAFAQGLYTYTSNPKTTVITDDEAANAETATFRTAYISGYNIGGKPQTAGTIELTYRSPKYWFIGVSANAAAGSFIDINFDRRTYDAVSFVPGTQAYKSQLAQEEYPAAYTLDMFCGASHKFGKGGILGINGNLTNILDSNFKTGGFEQSRFDVAALEKFPSKYYYSFGRTFYVQVYYRF